MPQTYVHRDASGWLRTFRQTDCAIEPGYVVEDNATFFTSAPNWIVHRPNAECAEELGHAITRCAWFLAIPGDHGLHAAYRPRRERTFDRSLKYPIGRDPAGKPLCRWCSKPVAPGRRAYCSDQCQIEVDLRTNAGAARRHVHDRDKSVCANCGVDCDLLRRVLGYAASSASNAENYGRRRLYPRFRFQWGWMIDKGVQNLATQLGFDVHKHFWEADHIIELSDGGDGGLVNLQTLCIPCHRQKTARLAGERAQKRRDAKRGLFQNL